MSENKNVWRLETAAAALAAVLVLGPLLIAPPFTHFLRCRVPGCEIAPDHEYQQIWDWITSMGAVTDWLLVVVGFLQWRIYTKQAVILTRQTETLPRIERAYVFAEVRPNDGGIAHKVGTDKDGNPIFETRIEVTFVNQGRTPARIKALRAYSDISPTIPMNIKNVAGSHRALPDGLFVKADGGYKIGVNSGRLLSRQWESVVLASAKMYCVGRMDYEDIFGDRHSTGFCWQYISHAEREGEFAISGDTPLNFFT